MCHLCSHGFAVMFFRVYLQYQRDPFLWAFLWADLCLKQLHIQLTLRPTKRKDHEETQPPCWWWTETRLTALTPAILGTFVLPVRHILSWHTWRAGANLYHNWTTSIWRRMSTPTKSVAPPSQYQRPIHPLRWRESPATPTPCMSPGHRGRSPPGWTSKAMIWSWWGPTPCTRKLLSLIELLLSRAMLCMLRSHRLQHLLVSLITPMSWSLGRPPPPSKATCMSRWKTWRLRSPNPRGEKT